MLKWISLFLFPVLLLSQEIEVQLATRSTLKPIYLSHIYPHSSKIHPNYCDELRSVLEFDLNIGGFLSVLDESEKLEAAFTKPQFDISLLKKEKIPYTLAIHVQQNELNVIAFNIEKGTSKKYSPIPLSGNLNEDRKSVHQFTDQLHKDLFGKKGVSSHRIIYAKRIKNGTEKGHEWLSEIWVSDLDGANATHLTSEKGYCLCPYFIPNSPNEFLYVSERTGQSKIYRASMVEPLRKPMVELRGNQALPSLSKNGKQIAFITDVAGRPDLFVQNFDSKGKMVGKAKQLFSAPRATQASPTYSPDASQIAFVSDKDGPPRIYILNTKETKRARPRLLTKKNTENTSPSWSPDGTKLAYSSKVDGIRQIWIYDFTTDEEIQLTTGGNLNKENPSWAPDSFHLIYNTESGESCELFLIHLNSSLPIQISKGIGQKRFASWEP